MPRQRDRGYESRGIALLDEAAGEVSPFRQATTQYIVLGDGRQRGGVRALLKAAVRPVVPIVSIDPEYAPSRGKPAPGAAQRRGARGASAGKRAARPLQGSAGKPLKVAYRSTRRVRYLGQRAEGYRFDKEALGKVDSLVLVAIGAHTSAWKFLKRARAAAGRRVKVYAVCAPCCFAGLRRPIETIRGQRLWQLVYPRGAPTAKRPLATAEQRRGVRAARTRARSREKLRLQQLREVRARARKARRLATGTKARRVTGRSATGAQQVQRRRPGRQRGARPPARPAAGARVRVRQAARS